MVDTKDIDAEELALLAIDAGADDVQTGKGYLEVYVSPQKLETVRKALEQKKPIISAEVSLVPKSTVMVDEEYHPMTVGKIDALLKKYGWANLEKAEAPQTADAEAPKEAPAQ